MEVSVQLDGRKFDKEQIRSALACAVLLVESAELADPDNGGGSSQEWADIDEAHTEALAAWPGGLPLGPGLEVAEREDDEPMIFASEMVVSELQILRAIRAAGALSWVYAGGQDGASLDWEDLDAVIAEARLALPKSKLESIKERARAENGCEAAVERQPTGSGAGLTFALSLELQSADLLYDQAYQFCVDADGRSMSHEDVVQALLKGDGSPDVAMCLRMILDPVHELLGCVILDSSVEVCDSQARGRCDRPRCGG